MNIGILEDIMLFDDHIDSKKENSISVTTLLGSNYKAKMYLKRAKKDKSLIDMKYKRSSFIGTSIHERAAYITGMKNNYKVERFVEREIVVDGITYTIAGSFDGIKKVNDKWYMYDYKSFYGNKRTEDALMKDSMQMSIYRWIFEATNPEIEIEDTAFSIAISQSNNYMEEIPVQLRNSKYIEDFIEAKLWTIIETETADCNDNVNYNSCTYCDYICEERK